MSRMFNPGQHHSIQGQPRWSGFSRLLMTSTSRHLCCPRRLDEREHNGFASPESGQASPRDNVVFEAGLFGGTLGMRRTFILHARGAKLPTDLLGLTCVRYDEATTAAEIKAINQKIRKAIEDSGRLSRIEGLWWQYSLTERTHGTFCCKPLADFARPRRCFRGDRSLLAREWKSVSQILE